MSKCICCHFPRCMVYDPWNMNCIKRKRRKSTMKFCRMWSIAGRYQRGGWYWSGVQRKLFKWCFVMIRITTVAVIFWQFWVHLHHHTLSTEWTASKTNLLYTRRWNWIELESADSFIPGPKASKWSNSPKKRRRIEQKNFFHLNQSSLDDK